MRAIDTLNAIIAKQQRWGFWKCFKRLRKDDKPWNHKKVHRMYCDMKLIIKRLTFKRKRQSLGTANEVNHVWALDFMRHAMYESRLLRTLNEIDEGNREALYIMCGTSIPSARLLLTKEQLAGVSDASGGIWLDSSPKLTV
jgi:putative transposase